MSPYAGEKPETDLEISWKDLLRPMNMRFSQEELNLMNQDSVALPEGGGYLGWFGVFHNLHCVVSRDNEPIMARTKMEMAENDPRIFRKGTAVQQLRGSDEEG